MRNLNEYEIRIRTEKHGVYVDHSPMMVEARSKEAAVGMSLVILGKRIQRMYQNRNPYKVTAWKNVMEDTIGSEISIIIMRLR